MASKLFIKLWNMGLLKDAPRYWWPDSLSFKCVVGTILTQNTRWENVCKSLEILENMHVFQSDDHALHELSNMSSMDLAPLVRSSGFFNQKATRLIRLSKNILQTFSSFSQFQSEVDREWLLSQKGIGYESADSILNYACGREVMVVDRYTQELLVLLGMDFENYGDIQDFLMKGIYESHKELLELSSLENVAHIFMIFHGMIVEVSKAKRAKELKRLVLN